MLKNFVKRIIATSVFQSFMFDFGRVKLFTPVSWRLPSFMETQKINKGNLKVIFTTTALQMWNEKIPYGTTW